MKDERNNSTHIYPFLTKTRSKQTNRLYLLYVLLYRLL